MKKESLRVLFNQYGEAGKPNPCLNGLHRMEGCGRLQRNGRDHQWKEQAEGGAIIGRVW